MKDDIDPKKSYHYCGSCNDRFVIVSQLLFFLFILCKPYYLWASGNAGIADLCLAASFITLLAVHVKEVLSGGTEKSIGGKLCGILYREDLLWYLFLAFVIVINGFYAWKCHSPEFLKYSAFWVFNGAAIWTYRGLCNETAVPAASVHFRICVSVCLGLDILVQMVVLLTGHGRVLTEAWGATRYVGTFNDPNQLAFFVFSAAMLAYLYAVTEKKKRLTLLKIIALLSVLGALILIIASKSTGVMLGMIVYFVLLWICSILLLLERGRIPKKPLVISVVVVLVLTGVLLALIWPDQSFDVQTVEYNTLTRFQEKLWKLSNGGLYGMILDRGMDKIVAFPHYILFGAGEGGFERFEGAAIVNEIHSGFFSILFCYGIIPTVLMCAWVLSCLRRMNRWQLCAALAVLAESMLLINYRQPMFWFTLL